MGYDRRRFIVATGAAGALVACSKPATDGSTGAIGRRAWTMVTSWAADLAGYSQAARLLADSITRTSGGRLSVEVFAANEKVPAFEVFDAVSRGTVEMGHSASYYWKSKHPSAPFFCTVPFGLNAQEMNAWLYFGGGLELWREVYAASNLVPFPAGNTGVQLAGWFNREISTLADLAGLKMRIPGLGAEVMARLGTVPVNLPGAEIIEAMKSGTIDATEWVGPWNDLESGIFRAAKYCYTPGWQEPGATFECMIHKPAFDALPADLQAVVEACCRAAGLAVLAEFTARNQRAMATLRDEHGVQFRQFPRNVLAALSKASDEVLEALAAGDPIARRVHDSQRQFREQARAWHAISEVAFYQARS